MTAFRHNDRQTPPRTNARPRRTLWGRLQQQWTRGKGDFRAHPVGVTAVVVFMIAATCWLRYLFPKAFQVMIWTYFGIGLAWHFWSNRGAE